MTEILNYITTEPNQDGIYKKFTKFKDGVITKQKIETIQKQIIEKKIHIDTIKRQKNWKPFGKALDENNKCCTFIGDEIFIESVTNKIKDSKVKNEIKNYNICSDLGIYKYHNSSLKNKKSNINKPNKGIYRPDFNKYKERRKQTEKQSDKKIIKTNKYVFKPKNTNLDNKSNTKLFLKNINEEWREDDIAELIEPLGEIKDIYILRNKRTGKSKGLAIVSVYKHLVGQAIIDRFNNKPMGSLIVNIEWAKEKER